jgi:hypothetical protein
MSRCVSRPSAITPILYSLRFDNNLNQQNKMHMYASFILLIEELTVQIKLTALSLFRFLFALFTPPFFVFFSFRRISRRTLVECFCFLINVDYYLSFSFFSFSLTKRKLFSNVHIYLYLYIQMQLLTYNLTYADDFFSSSALIRSS